MSQSISLASVGYFEIQYVNFKTSGLKFWDIFSRSPPSPVLTKVVLFVWPTYASSNSEVMVDVTNTSNIKVAFEINVSNAKGSLSKHVLDAIL